MPTLQKSVKSLAFVLCFFHFGSLHAQQVAREEIIAAYVYSFARNIEWPDNNDTFNIQLVTDNLDVVNQFILLSESKKIRGKKIEIISSQSAIISQQTNLVFISKNYNSVVRSVFLQLQGQNILMVTDEFGDNRFTMINFREDEDNTIGFELNQANLINHGLKVLPEIILLGGSDIDMAQLYREAQDSINSLEFRVGGLQGQYDSLLTRINTIQNDIQQKEDLVSHQLEEIRLKQKIIQDQSKSLDSLTIGIYKSTKKLEQLVSDMQAREKDFRILQESIEMQEVKLAEGGLILEEQFRLIEEQDNKISESESSLQKVVSQVSSQKKTVVLLSLFSLFVLAFLFAVVRAYKERRDHAKKLAIQKDELSQLLDELRQTQSQLVQSEKMASLGVLTAGIAHEINNAINFVASGVHVLEKNIEEVTPVINRVRKLKKGDAKLQEHIDKLIDIKEKIGYEELQRMIREVVKHIKIGAERTTDIVKGLRTFSMDDTENITAVDLENELDVALLLLNNKVKDRIQVTKDIAKGIPEIRGYKGQLGQVFLNILSNAIDALENKPDPIVNISMKKKQGKIIIEIADSGEGIAKEDMERIFDPFYTTKKPGAGTGLGLSVAYGIIERHQGTINVSSEKDKGTIFSIYLPL